MWFWTKRVSRSQVMRTLYTEGEGLKAGNHF